VGLATLHTTDIVADAVTNYPLLMGNLVKQEMVKERGGISSGIF
jgi:hypothetical protein